MKILLVEDENIIRESLKADILRLKHECEYEVFTAASVKEAEVIFNDENPALVITDINMPPVSGLVLIEKIRKISLNCAIIVLSAYDNFEYVRKAFISGANDYILKPISFSELDAKVRYLLHDETRTPFIKEEDEIYINREMQEAFNFVNNNLSRAISMSDVADYISVSYSHFSRLFRHSAGMTFPQYLLRTRMEKAKEYLAVPHIKISVVAKKVGYGDSAQHFSRDFHKTYGITPSDYQKSLQ